MLEIIHRKKRLSSFKLIALGFAGVIVLGALILMLPFSSNTGRQSCEIEEEKKYCGDDNKNHRCY